MRGIHVHAGARFLVVLTEDILRGSGLPRRPLAEKVHLDARAGEIVALE